MRSCGTRRTKFAGVRRLRRGLSSVIALAAIALAAADALAHGEQHEQGTHREPPVEPNDSDLDVRGEATVGANIYVIDSPYDDGDLGGFLDQYQYTRNKGGRSAYFVDLMHLDLGIVRDDDTHLLRIERFSPNQLNDRGELELELDWRGVGLDIDYWRFRTEQLRFFPVGHFDVTPGGAFDPNAFYATYELGETLDEALARDRRFYVQRTGLDGEIRFRPEAAGFTLPVLSEVSVTSGYEERKGWRQDSLELDEVEFGRGRGNFRGHRRRIDQEVTNVGGGFVLAPMETVTADFRIDFETFREKARTATSGTLLDDIAEAPGQPTINFIPDTNRLTGSTRLAAKIGEVNLHGSAFVTHLSQSDHAPVRRRVDKHDVTTWSVHSGFDIPFADRFSLAGYAKLAERRNDMDQDDVAPQVPVDPLLTQVDPILRRRTEIDGEVELSFTPQAGALLAAGYRFDFVDRKLRYGDGGDFASEIKPNVSLVQENGEQHTLFVRGRARLKRSVQVSGELGFDYQPEASFPRDPRHTLYFDGRGSYAIATPVPTTFAVFGGVRDAHGSGLVLDVPDLFGGADTFVRKDFDRLLWNYGATVTAVPLTNTTLSVTFAHSHDEQDMPYARTQLPRFLLSGLSIFEEPDRVDFESDVKSLTISGTQRITPQLDLSSFVNVSWVKAGFPGSGALANALEDVNEIRSRLLGVGATASWTAVEGLAFGLGYRFDTYVDLEDKEPITRDDERHTVTLTATVNLDLLRGLTD